MPTRTTTAPEIEPISAEDAKAHLRLESSDEDGTVDGLIVAARQLVEAQTNRALITQVVTLTADRFPCCCGDGWHEFDGVRSRENSIKLWGGRVQSVTSIHYTDADGTDQVWGTSNYRVDTTSEPARITPAYGKTWPTTRCQTGAVTVVYEAGYGDDAEDVPQAIRQAVLLYVGHLYENRQPVSIGNIVTPIPMSVESLLNPYRVF